MCAFVLYEVLYLLLTSKTIIRRNIKREKLSENLGKSFYPNENLGLLTKVMNRFYYSVTKRDQYNKNSKLDISKASYLFSTEKNKNIIPKTCGRLQLI